MDLKNIKDYPKMKLKEWNENGKKASERGTALHKLIELFIMDIL